MRDAGGGGTVSFIHSLLAGNFRTESADPVALLEIKDCAGSLVSTGANDVGDLDPP
jgi:hypothetical protein